MNSEIARIKRETGKSYEWVLKDIEIMEAAKRRFETGQLTDEDHREIKRCTRDFYDRGGHCWRGR